MSIRVEDFIKSDVLQKAFEINSEKSEIPVELKNLMVLKRMNSKLADFTNAKTIIRQKSQELGRIQGSIAFNLKVNNQDVKNQKIPTARVVDFEKVDPNGKYILSIMLPRFPEMTDEQREDWLLYWGINKLFVFQQPENPAFSSITNKVGTLELFVESLEEDVGYPQLFRFRPMRVGQIMNPEKTKSIGVGLVQTFQSTDGNLESLSVTIPKKLIAGIYESFVA